MYTGIIIGACTFLAIGIFHPIVIKCEYYFTASVWPVFLAAGIILCLLSLIVSGVVLSAVLAICGFSSLWSIKELKEQEERVAKGWFPANPARRITSPADPEQV